MAYKPLARGMVNYLSVDPLFKELYQKYDCTVCQLAFAWLISKPNVFVWMKSVNRSHINENLDSFGLNIEEEDLKRIDDWRYESK